jgi:hypothetical protein
MNPEKLALALDGEARGNEVLAPGPGHSHNDRSLSVRLSSDAPDGFLTHSFAGDDPIICRDYVRQKLGLPAWQPKSKTNGANGRAATPRHKVAEYTLRVTHGPMAAERR